MPRCASSGPSIRRKMAVSRIWGVNPSGLTCWNETEDDDLSRVIGLVSDDVNVVAALVNKRHARCVDGPRAGGIVSVVLCDCSCRNNDQAVARMRVPARGSSLVPTIAKDKPVRQSLRPLP